MTNAYELRNHFFLEDYNTAITRVDFETFFTKTKEKVIFIFTAGTARATTAKAARPRFTAPASRATRTSG